MSVRLGAIVGAPRSGTTWLQRLLCAHPAVTSPQETHLFHDFLRPLYGAWDARSRRVETVVRELESGARPSRRLIGLPTIVEEARFEQVARDLLAAVVDRAVEAKPGATWVLEKTPSNSLAVGAIDRAAPDARYLHIVRDPHDVVRSLLAISRTWGADWAPRSARAAAELWVSHVRGARSAARFGDRYLEIRYEDLLARPQEGLARVFGFLDVPITEAELTELLAQAERREAGEPEETFAFAASLRDRLEGRTDVEPSGFRTGSSAYRLGRAESFVVDSVAGDLMSEWGYPRRSSPIPIAGRAVRAASAARRRRR